MQENVSPPFAAALLRVFTSYATGQAVRVEDVAIVAQRANRCCSPRRGCSGQGQCSRIANYAMGIVYDRCGLATYGKRDLQLAVKHYIHAANCTFMLAYTRLTTLAQREKQPDANRYLSRMIKYD